jgi:hypothetical protein
MIGMIYENIIYYSVGKDLGELCISDTGCELCWYMAIIPADSTKCCRELAKFCRVWPTRVAGCETCWQHGHYSS